MIDSNLVTAGAATLGSLVGAMASIATTWMSHRTETIRANAEWRHREREALFKEFITEASRLAVDSYTHAIEHPQPLMALYGVLSRIRIVAGQEVVHQGEVCCHRIITQYEKPAITPEQLRALIVANRADELDVVKAFSIACRNVLLRGR
jgi:hypothetical protein